MNFEESLVHELQSIPGLSGKVFPQRATDETKPPFVVYHSSDGEPIMTLNGPTNMIETNCDIHVIAETYEKMKSLTKAVLDRIQSFFQRKIGREGVYIKSVSYIEPVEDIDSNTSYHKSSFNIRVRY